MYRASQSSQSYARKIVRIKDGRLAGQMFEIEGTLEDVFGRNTTLPDLFARGNITAIKAVREGHYTHLDEPLFYGKVGSLGHILAKRELEL